MRYETIRLNDVVPELPKLDKEKIRWMNASSTPDTDSLRKANVNPTLTVYSPDNSVEIEMNRRRPSIVICPGGAYEETVFRENEPVVLKFLSLGYNVFILKYSVLFAKFPTSLLQLSAAVAFIRRRAKEYNADINRIAVCGFSAGGHLAGSLGVFWSEPFITQTLQLEAGLNQPNGLILCYPVITSGEYAHVKSFDRLLGSNASNKLRESVSLEKQVNSKVPPTFLWHTFEDQIVPVENSLLFAGALRKNHIPFELHIFPSGRHGMSLCTHETGTGDYINLHCANWVALCDEWMKSNITVTH
jgi:acetyl esterase/lipase